MDHSMIASGTGLLEASVATTVSCDVSPSAVKASSAASKAYKAQTEIEREALEVLVQLGERQNDAEELIGKAMRNYDNIKTTDALVQAVYRIKMGARTVSS